MNPENHCKKNPDIPGSISHRHPDARIASKKDFMPRLIVATIVFLMIAVICGLLFFKQETARAETERIIGYQVTVDGVVTKTEERKSRSGKSITTTHYASYRYFYGQNMYTGKTKISAGSISKDQTVTVYVDPTRPSESRLFHENILPEIIIAAVFILVTAYWLWMLNKCRLCFQGRMVIYKQKRPGRKNDFQTVWKKIK